MDLLEKQIDEKNRKFAEDEMGWLWFKLPGNVFGRSGWPDVFLFKYGVVLIVEDKRRVKKRATKTTALQDYVHGLLLDAGHKVHVCPSHEEFRELILWAEEEYGPPKTTNQK